MLKHKILLLIGFVVLNTTNGMTQEIVAHRGASYIAPENTLAAVKLGYELGAEAVEVDVYLTKDHKIIALHDRTTKRTGDAEYAVAETDSEVLRGLDVGSWKDSKYAGEKMPFLEELLEVVPQGRKLVIEVKSGPEILPYLEEQIAKSSIKDRLVLISFNLEVVKEGKKRMPFLPTYWLLGSFNQYSMAEAVKIAEDNNFEGLDVNYNLVTPGFVKAMREADLEIYVYTVNDREVARILRDLKVDAITTDRPEWLRKGL